MEAFLVILFAAFVLVSMGFMLYMARREDFVFYLEEEELLEFYSAKIRIDQEKITIYTRRLAKKLRTIKKFTNEELGVVP